MHRWALVSGTLLLRLTAAGAARGVMIEDWMTDAVGRRGRPPRRSASLAAAR